MSVIHVTLFTGCQSYIHTCKVSVMHDTCIQSQIYFEICFPLYSFIFIVIITASVIIIYYFPPPVTFFLFWFSIITANIALCLGHLAFCLPAIFFCFFFFSSSQLILHFAWDIIGHSIHQHFFSVFFFIIPADIALCLGHHRAFCPPEIFFFFFFIIPADIALCLGHHRAFCPPAIFFCFFFSSSQLILHFAWDIIGHSDMLPCTAKVWMREPQYMSQRMTDHRNQSS